MRLIDFSFNDYVLNRTGEISSPIRAGMGGCPGKMSESRSRTQKISRDNRDPVLPPPIGKELKAMKKDRLIIYWTWMKEMKQIPMNQKSNRISYLWLKGTHNFNLLYF